MKIVIITGMSGAGKSAALNIFEDIGYYCMDNLPPQLIQNFIELSSSSKKIVEKLAVVVDIRGGQFFDDMKLAIQNLKNAYTDLNVLFLDSRDDVLVRRYMELKRPHPVAKEKSLIESIHAEREILSDIREITNHYIDTTDLKIGELRNLIIQEYEGSSKFDSLLISLTSFGYKYGIPLDSDIVMDVRFLPNPFYVEDLKSRNGTEEEVQEYLNQSNSTSIFINKFVDLLEFLLPLYKKEGKSSLSIAIGCTGGQHRSPAIAIAIAERLQLLGENAVLNHRDEAKWTC